MTFNWMFFVELGIISLALLIGTVLRAKFSFFQKFLIPNSITAGLLLLLFYNIFAPRLNMTTEFLENLVFHLLNISFVAMSLRKPEKTDVKRHIVFPTAVTIVSQYVFQGVLGMLLTFLFINTVFPHLFPTFGFFVPLGFALGPGQAFAIGKKWEAPAFGFEGSGTVGLTFAAAGYFFAIFGGVFLVNLALKKGWIKRPADETNGDNRTGLYKRHDSLPVGSRLTTFSEAIETLSFNVAAILAVYLISYLFLRLVTWALAFAGPMGISLAESLWGIAFIFCAMFGMIVRKILSILKVDHTLETGTITRTAGFFVDFMVAAAIGAISVKFVAQYWIPILTMCLSAGVLTMLTLLWFGSRLFSDYKFERTILLYGVLTGTLPSGLTLLRVVDPEFKTPVASDYIPAAGLTFVFCIPYILMVDLPAYGYRDHNPIYYWITAACFAVYLAFVFISFFRLTRGKRVKGYTALWKN